MDTERRPARTRRARRPARARAGTVTVARPREFTRKLTLRTPGSRATPRARAWKPLTSRRTFAPGQAIAGVALTTAALAPTGSDNATISAKHVQRLSRTLFDASK